MAAFLGVVLLATAAGTATAYVVTTGAGTGAATAGTMHGVTVVTAGTSTTPLLPGQSGDLVFTVANANAYPVTLTAVTLQVSGVITPDSGHSGCGTTDATPVVTLTVPTGDLPVVLAAGGSTPVDVAGAVTMALAATSSCQGALFSVPISVTVSA